MGYRGTGKGWMSSHGYRLNALGITNGREYEHRLIAAKVLGRKLKKQEEVHHVNGNGAMNHHANLIICDRAFHKYLHFMERVKSLGYTRQKLFDLHHGQGLPLEELKRRLNLGEGMIGRWFRRMNIPIDYTIGRQAAWVKRRSAKCN